MGTKQPHLPNQCAPPRQNERASSERALKWGARGTSRDFFASGLSRESSIPCLGPGGKSPSQVLNSVEVQT